MKAGRHVYGRGLGGRVPAGKGDIFTSAGVLHLHPAVVLYNCGSRVSRPLYSERKVPIGYMAQASSTKTYFWYGLAFYTGTCNIMGYDFSK